MDTKKKKDSPRTGERPDGTASGQAPAPQEQRRPIHQVRLDDISASVWKREHSSRGQTLTFYSVTPERSYKDRDGQYRYTHSFDADSLGALVTVLQKAQEYIHGLQYPEPAQR